MALAVLGAWVYLAFAVFFTPPPKGERRVEVYLLREAGQRLLRLDTVLEDPEHWSSYMMWLEIMAYWRQKIAEAGQSEEVRPADDIQESEFFLDLLEFTLFKWLASRYRGHWHVARVITKGLSGENWSMTPHPEAERKMTPISLHEMMNLLRENSLVKAGVELPSQSLEEKARMRQLHKIDMFEGFMLPDGAKVNISREPHSRMISIKTYYPHSALIHRANNIFELPAPEG